MKGLYPADLPESRNPDFIDNVFDNKGVLWAARLLLVSAAAVLACGGIWRQAALANQEEIASLREHLEKSDELVEKLRDQ